MEKSIYFTTVAAFGATLFAGCGMELADGQGNGGQPAQAVRTQSSVQKHGAAAAISPALGPARDARAAAAAAPAATDPPRTATITPLTSWYSGTVQPGGQQYWQWNNAGTGVYQVGFSPVGASSSSVCQFEVIDSFDVSLESGERQFHFVIENTGSIACAANILLASQAPSSTSSFGGMNPGETQIFSLSSGNSTQTAFNVNVEPSGATPTYDCQFAVIPISYADVPTAGGTDETQAIFSFEVTNIGSIACTGTILAAANTSVNSSWSLGTIGPGGSAGWTWNNANPLNRVYVPGVYPSGGIPGAPCQLQLLPGVYQQEITASGTTERRFSIAVQNTGSSICTGMMLLNYLDS